MCACTHCSLLIWTNSNIINPILDLHPAKYTYQIQMSLLLSCLSWAQCSFKFISVLLNFLSVSAVNVWVMLLYNILLLTQALYTITLIMILFWFIRVLDSVSSLNSYLAVFIQVINASFTDKPSYPLPQHFFVSVHCIFYSKKQFISHKA